MTSCAGSNGLRANSRITWSEGGGYWSPGGARTRRELFEAISAANAPDVRGGWGVARTDLRPQPGVEGTQQNVEHDTRRTRLRLE
jgi:hypothetical protein